MEKAKEIFKLVKMGLSQRDVADDTGCSLGMVNAVLAKLKGAGVLDPLSLETKELGSIITASRINMRARTCSYAGIRAL